MRNAGSLSIYEHSEVNSRWSDWQLEYSQWMPQKHHSLLDSWSTVGNYTHPVHQGQTTRLFDLNWWRWVYSPRGKTFGEVQLGSICVSANLTPRMWEETGDGCCGTLCLRPTLEHNSALLWFFQFHTLQRWWLFFCYYHACSYTTKFLRVGWFQNKAKNEGPICQHI